MLIDKLEKIIDYKFKNQSLLIQAITHSSSTIVNTNENKINFGIPMD